MFSAERPRNSFSMSFFPLGRRAAAASGLGASLQAGSPGGLLMGIYSTGNSEEPLWHAALP